MTLSGKQREFARMVGEFITWAYTQGYQLTLGEAYRTPEQQKIYMDTGKSKTILSKHLDRLAIDLNLWLNGKYVTDEEAYKPLGEYWESIGGRWGGRFGDNPATEKIEGWDAGHFEYGG